VSSSLRNQHQKGICHNLQGLYTAPEGPIHQSDLSNTITAASTHFNVLHS